MKTHRLLLFVIAFVLILLTANCFKAYAEEVTFTVSVNNVEPSTTDILIDGGSEDLEMTEGTTTDVVVTAVVTDNNGCGDISLVEFVFYRTDVDGGSSCVPNAYNCYVGTGSVVSSGNTCEEIDLEDPESEVDVSAEYVVTFPVWYYADATDSGEYADSDWSAVAIPYDSNGSGITGDPDDIELATLLAVDINSPIEFGTMSLGDTSDASEDYDTVVTNTGNKSVLGLQVRGTTNTAMTCSLGAIPIANLRYDDSSIASFEEKTSLSLDYATVEDVSIPKGPSGNSDTVGWGLQIPESGLNGVCSGEVEFSPI